MATTVRIKRRNTGALGAPGNLANAELAYNEVDNTLYYGQGTGGSGGTASSVVPIAGTGAFLPLWGGTVSGNTTFSGAPVTLTGSPPGSIALNITSNTQIGLHLSSGTFSGPAIRLATGQHLGFTVTSNRNLWWDNAGTQPGLHWNTNTVAAPNKVVTLGDNGAVYSLLGNWADGPAQTSRAFRVYTDGTLRWLFGSNATAEAGSDAGCDLDLVNYNDAGTALVNPVMRVTRSTGNVLFNRGVSFSSQLAPGGTTDLSRHIALYGTSYGLNITSGRLNYVSGGSHVFVAGATDKVTISSTGLTMAAATDITLVRDPTLALQAVTKQYADRIVLPVFISIAALRAATTATLTQGQAFIAGYDATSSKGQGNFAYVATDTTSADNDGFIIVDASSRRWHRLGWQDGSISAEWFGCKGDAVVTSNATDMTITGTDDTARLQTAINAATAVQQALYIPAGKYLYSAQLNIQRSVHIYGDVCEFTSSVGVFGANQIVPGNGTWLVNNGSMVSAFMLRPVGSPSVNNRVFGVEIHHVGFVYKQATLGVSWAPTQYPPTFYFDSVMDIELHHLTLLNPFIAFSTYPYGSAASNRTDRLTVHHCKGQPIARVAFLDYLTDTLRFHDNHWWVFWSLDQYVLQYQQVFGAVYDLGRVDNPCFTNDFAYNYHLGVLVQVTSNGHTSIAQFVGCGFDHTNYMCQIIVSTANAQHTVYFTGCYNQGFVGDNASGVYITGATSNAIVLLTQCDISLHDGSSASIDATGPANYIMLSNCKLTEWDKVGHGNPALAASGAGNIIRADASTWMYSSMNSSLAGGHAIKDVAMFNSSCSLGFGSIATTTQPHGLGFAPGVMNVTAMGNITPATRVWITADANNYTVTTDVAPAASPVNFSVQLGIIAMGQQ